MIIGTTLIDQMIDRTNHTHRRRSILFVGDSMTDVYVHGRVESCQEGCTKFIEETRCTVPGGAANAARSVENWRAGRVEKFIANADIIPRKIRFMVGNEFVFRHDDDRCDYDFDVVRRSTMSTFEMWRYDAVLISDYDKGLLAPGFMHAVIDTCRDRGIPCVADVKREPGLYRGAIIKGNTEWFNRHAEGARTLDSQAVGTHGRHNPIVWDRGSIWRDPTPLPVVPCINHVGAGDCFAAHLALALACGFSLKDAAAIAHSAGRVYVQHPHNRPPTPEEIRADMAGDRV